MSSFAVIAATFVVVLAMFVGYIYVFGIPPETKRKMEDAALNTMGETKGSYMVKDTINKIPASDQQEVKDLKKSLGNAAGGVLQNPLGKMSGDAADDATRPMTGR